MGTAELVYDSLITWNLLGRLQVTKLSLAFFRQFDKDVKIGTYSKNSRTYAQLTDALRNWAEQTLLFVADHIPDDYVLPMAMDRITAQPTGARGTIHCLIASLSVYNAYKGLVPPSWYNGYSNDEANLISGESYDSSWVLKNIGSAAESQYRAGV